MKIAIFTASTPIGALYPKRALRAINFLKEQNNEIILGSLFAKKDAYRSSTIINRANEINQLIDLEIDILMSSIGGLNTSSVLPYLNYKNFKDNLIVCGFSDTTALLNAVINFCPKVRVFYGPALFPSFGDYELEYCQFTYESLINRIANKRNILMPKFWSDEKCNWEEYEKTKNTNKNKWYFINANTTITGRLIGGNLNTIIATYGSKYGIEIRENDILLIEDSQKTASEWERNVSFLKINGIFSKIKALIISKHELFDAENSNKTPVMILEEVMRDEKIPIVHNVDFGHTKPMVIVELNKNITIDFQEEKIYQ